LPHFPPPIPDPARLRLDAGIAGGHLQVKFSRRLAGTHDLGYTVQVSPDLMGWDTLSASEIGIEPSELPGFERAVYQADMAVFAQSPLFVRLKIGWEQ
jgi:hypothetical protein